MKGHY